MLTSTIPLWVIVFGFLAGVLFMKGINAIRYSKYCFGKIMMDTNDPDKDIYRMEYSKHPAGMKKCKYVIFNIKTGYDFGSQKIQSL